MTEPASPVRLDSPDEVLRRAAERPIREANEARQRAEDAVAALSAAERRMQQALLASHSFTFEWNPATDEVLRSDSCGAILGLDGAAALGGTGQGYFQRIHPDDRDRFLGTLQSLSAASPDYAAEYRVVRDDGSVVTLEETGQARFGPEGDLERLFGVATDVSERRRIEGALRRVEQHYRLLHESLRDGFVQVSMDGRIVDCNEIYCRMLGCSAEEMRRLTYEAITPDRWHAFEAGIVRDQILVRGYSDVYEKEYRRKDGAVFPVELRTVLARDDEGRPPCGPS